MGMKIGWVSCVCVSKVIFFHHGKSPLNQHTYKLFTFYHLGLKSLPSWWVRSIKAIFSRNNLELIPNGGYIIDRFGTVKTLKNCISLLHCCSCHRSFHKKTISPGSQLFPRPRWRTRAQWGQFGQRALDSHFALTHFAPKKSTKNPCILPPTPKFPAAPTGKMTFDDLEEMSISCWSSSVGSWEHWPAGSLLTELPLPQWRVVKVFKV